MYKYFICNRFKKILMHPLSLPLFLSPNSCTRDCSLLRYSYEGNDTNEEINLCAACYAVPSNRSTSREVKKCGGENVLYSVIRNEMAHFLCRALTSYAVAINILIGELVGEWSNHETMALLKAVEEAPRPIVWEHIQQKIRNKVNIMIVTQTVDFSH